MRRINYWPVTDTSCRRRLFESGGGGTQGAATTGGGLPKRFSAFSNEATNVSGHPNVGLPDPKRLL